MRWARVVGVTLACAACAHAPSPVAVGPPPKLPTAKVRAPRPPPPAEWYWTPVVADVHAPPRKPLAFPVPDAAIVKHDAAWNALPPEAKEKLRTTGVAVIGSEIDPPPKAASTFGAFYTETAEAQKTPQLITLDALFQATRLGLELAVAQAEEQLAAPLEAFITKLDARLTQEQKGVGATLSEAYRIARGIIAVAGSAKPPADIAAMVNAERALIDAHAVTAVSPTLGFPIDYTRFAVPASAGRPALFKSLAWLGSVPFPLVARAEEPGAPLYLAQTRTSTRAAMILARLIDNDIDVDSNALYMRLSRFLGFGWGASDDLTLPELDEIGTKAGVDLTKPEHIIDVAKVDQVRFGARKRPAPAIYDGPGSIGRAARIFGGHASPDGMALTALLGPKVGAPQEGAPPSILRDGNRVIPTTLDIAAWLEAPGAKAALKESRADAFSNFDAALGKLIDERDLDAFHSSIFDSFLAAAGEIGSEADPGTPARLETMLSAWTMVRHLDQPFARAKPKALAPRETFKESSVPVLVENAPETIARLLATVRQAKKGLEAYGLYTADSPLPMLDDLLKIALTAAEHRANSEPLDTKVTTLPARIAAMEEDATAAVVSVVSADPPSRRLLVTATGRIEPIYEITRDIGRDEPLLVVGAHVAHHEIVTDAGEMPNDSTWKAKIATASRAAYTSGFRIVPPSRNPQ